MKGTFFIIIFFSHLIFSCCAQKDQKSDRPLKAPHGYLNETLLKVVYALGFLDIVETKPTVPGG
ncbi:unnamed protein product, partial [marine sediment metagenome]